MFALTVTEAASTALAQAIQESGLTATVISFSQSSRHFFPDGLDRTVGPNASDAALRECGLSLDRSKLIPVQWIVEAGVFPLGEVPEDQRVEVGGVWFAFSREVRELISGGILEFSDGSYVLSNSSGEVILPLKLERYTNARA